MREIKFRGKNLYEECIIDIEAEDGARWIEPGRAWVYGGYVEIDGTPFIFPKENSHCAQGDFWSDNDAIGICVVVKRTVGQYTGMKDKNGREIYEGDILRLVYPEYAVTVKVEWSNKGSCCFSVARVDMEEKSFVLDRWEAQHAEVIGNIHDNPELLKKE